MDFQWVVEPPWRRAAAEWHKVCAFTLMRVLGEYDRLAAATRMRFMREASEGCRPTLLRWPCEGRHPSCHAPCPNATRVSSMRDLPHSEREGRHAASTSPPTS